MRNTNKPILEVTSVSASYGAISALKEVSFTAFAGELIAIIGANGAGKSTLLNVLAGVVPAQNGTINLNGEPLENSSVTKRVQKGISLVPEGRKIFPRLTIKENLRIGAYSRENKQTVLQDMDKMYTLFPVLKERHAQLGGTLSGGEQQMLALARALMSAPQLLLLDEPSMGIAPIIVARIFEKIRELNEAGLTIVLVEQNARLALRQAHRAYVLEQGKIVIEGKASDLLHDARIQASYLGG